MWNSLRTEEPDYKRRLKLIGWLCAGKGRAIAANGLTIEALYSA